MTAEFYDARAALFAAHAPMKAVSKSADTVMNTAECDLAKRELRGLDTSFARTALYEAEWRIKCTNDSTAAQEAVDRLIAALDRRDPPGDLYQDADGSFAMGSDVFWLKLSRSTDQLIARDWPWRRPPAFLERINDPAQMVTYLQDLRWSDVVRCGEDNRKELNEAISVIARIVVRGGQAGYLSGPNFYPVFARFIRDWQDPDTGFFGMTYFENGDLKSRTCDLSLTFHMVRYVPHLVRWWPQLIHTLLNMQHGQYPQGWLESGKMTDHNNYDVVELFYRGWLHMEPGQRKIASEAVEGMFDWCLDNSLSAEGEVVNPDIGDPIPDSYYFAAAFLDTIGFFEPTKRFWTKASLPDCEKIRNGMIAKLKLFDPYYPVVDDALKRLGGPPRPWTNAII